MIIVPDTEARMAFPGILKSYMDQFRFNQSDLARLLNVSKQTVSEWISGKKFPRVDKMQEIANLFGVYMSDMYTPSRHQTTTKENLISDAFQISDDEKHLIDLYRGADDRAREDAVRMLADHQKKDTESSAI